MNANQTPSFPFRICLDKTVKITCFFFISDFLALKSENGPTKIIFTLLFVYLFTVRTVCNVFALGLFLLNVSFPALWVVNRF